MEVPPFYAQEIPIYEGARMEIIWEHLGIWSPPGAREYKQPGEASQLANLVVAAWALLSGRKVRPMTAETSEIRRRQTGAFRPGSAGCLQELDAHFAVA
jgi:hypothetical protein